MAAIDGFVCRGRYVREEDADQISSSSAEPGFAGSGLKALGSAHMILSLFA
jgi:hypothetical protein